MTADTVVSTALGAGYFPLVPGTFASALAAILYKIVLSRWPWPLFAGLIAAVAAAGIAASSSLSRRLGQRDPRIIVIDEVAGQWVALFLVPPTWLSVAVGFALFRVLDVLKPFGIRRVERLPAGWGIMADDLVAGLGALAALQAGLGIL